MGVFILIFSAVWMWRLAISLSSVFVLITRPSSGDKPLSEKSLAFVIQTVGYSQRKYSQKDTKSLSQSFRSATFTGTNPSRSLRKSVLTESYAETA
jgi:hypothetical protein